MPTNKTRDAGGNRTERCGNQRIANGTERDDDEHHLDTLQHHGLEAGHNADDIPSRDHAPAAQRPGFIRKCGGLVVQRDNAPRS